MSNTQLEMYDTPKRKREKRLEYLKRNIKKFEFYCEQKDYQWVADTMKKIRKEKDLKTNTDVFLFLLRDYENR